MVMSSKFSALPETSCCEWTNSSLTLKAPRKVNRKQALNKQASKAKLHTADSAPSAFWYKHRGDIDWLASWHCPWSHVYPSSNLRTLIFVHGSGLPEALAAKGKASWCPWIALTAKFWKCKQTQYNIVAWHLLKQARRGQAPCSGKTDRNVGEHSSATYLIEGAKDKQMALVISSL